MTKAFELAQKAADLFNLHYPVGTSIKYLRGTTNESYLFVVAGRAEVMDIFELGEIYILFDAHNGISKTSFLKLNVFHVKHEPLLFDKFYQILQLIKLS